MLKNKLAGFGLAICVLATTAFPVNAAETIGASENNTFSSVV